MQDIINIVDKAKSGDVNALKAYGDLKKIQFIINVAVKQVEPIAFEEADKYDEKQFDYAGFHFEKRNGSKRFSYKNIPEWQTYDKAKKDCEARYKQAFLSSQKGLLPVTTDGEELILPEVTYTKDSLIVKRNV